MKKIAVASLLALTFVSACNTPSGKPKATSAPPSQATPSIGRQYGETLQGGIAKAKEMQKTAKDRNQQIDNAANQNQPGPGE